MRPSPFPLQMMPRRGVQKSNEELEFADSLLEEADRTSEVLDAHLMSAKTSSEKLILFRELSRRQLQMLLLQIVNIGKRRQFGLWVKVRKDTRGGTGIGECRFRGWIGPRRTWHSFSRSLKGDCVIYKIR